MRDDLLSDDSEVSVPSDEPRMIEEAAPPVLDAAEPELAPVPEIAVPAEDAAYGAIEADLLLSESKQVGAEPVFSEPGLAAYVEPDEMLATEPPAVSPGMRIPNAADAAIFVLLLLVGFLVAAVALIVAFSLHWLERWLGIKDMQAAQTDTVVALGTQFLLYAVTLAGAVPLFRRAWGKPFFAGLHWHAATAWRLRWWLLATAVLCNGLALAANTWLPQPDHPPIELLFRTSRDAWLLMGFGVLIAPLFEEMIFRGFLLPAFATSWDWCMERFTHTQPRPLDAEGNPVWSVPAMVVGSFAVSLPFALMHSAQLGAAWGPLLLLYCISLILCATRLRTRSLACSTLVHATYNLILFGITLVQTSGFRHLDKM